MTFGGLGWTCGEQSFRLHQSHAMTAIFANLILSHDLTRPRDAVAEAIWPEADKEKSRSNLNSAVWRLRNDLKTRQIDDYIQINGDREFLNLQLSDGVMTDFGDLCQQVEICERLQVKNETPSADVIASLQNAVSNYQAEFVPGIYFDWAIAARERFRMRYLQACEILMQIFERHGQIDTALKYGHKILEQDNLRETTHRHLIEIYAANGLRHQAVLQFRSLTQILKTELGLTPSREISDLIATL